MEIKKCNTGPENGLLTTRCSQQFLKQIELALELTTSFYYDRVNNPRFLEVVQHVARDWVRVGQLGGDG